jgi:RluA family pseudouridine synthase
MTTAVSTLPYLNIAAYKFITLDNLPARREQYYQAAKMNQLRGTILLSPEGINMFLAGKIANLRTFLSELLTDEAFNGLEVKESFSQNQPFNRLLVRLKNEIIAFGIEEVDPRKVTAPRISPHELKNWLAAGREVILLDTRNDYEIDLGTFENAVPIGLNHFRHFPEAVSKLPEDWKDKTIVSFCTGGIRCEKAAPYMQMQGFKHVYQLHGGILKYFEDCGGEHYKGDCFVFDQRVALDPNLRETKAALCFACLSPLKEEDQQSPLYQVGISCPKCYVSPADSMQKRIDILHEDLHEITTPLPGLTPYDNYRPISVPKDCDQQTLLEFLTNVGRFRTQEEWLACINSGRILHDNNRVSADRIVRSGERFQSIEPGMTEPPVSTNIQIIYDDEAMFVVNKPAPLPMHPCGRFNKHTLEYFLQQVYNPVKVRPAHRIDANTTGLALFTKSRAIAAIVQPGFERGDIKKTYLARIQGYLLEPEITCSEQIISKAQRKAGARFTDPNGQTAITIFRELKRLNDGTSLITAQPLTGRTNQIRVHLWHYGTPIIGDPMYLPEKKLGSTQTITPTDSPMSLHAWKLTMKHPVTNAEMNLEAQIPHWAN